MSGENRARPVRIRAGKVDDLVHLSGLMELSWLFVYVHGFDPVRLGLPLKCLLSHPDPGTCRVAGLSVANADFGNDPATACSKKNPGPMFRRVRFDS